MKRRGRPGAVVVDAERLRGRRRELGLSRDDLAQRAGVARSTIQLVENEARGAPATLAKLAGALGIAVTELAPSLGARQGDALAERGLMGPPPRVSLQGRAQVLAVLREALRAPGVVCLVGPMGIGKTALASTLAAELGDEGPVAWLSESRLAQSFPPYDLQLSVAEALGFATRLPPVTAPATAIDAVYREHAGSRLRATVLDDVQSERFVRHFEAGTTLCTTHSRALAEAVGARVVELDALGPEDARALLRSYLPEARLEADAAGAEQLLGRLGGVPRSLHIAGRALRELTYVTPGAYAARIRRDPSAHVNEAELTASHDPDERRDASQIVGYQELEGRLPASTRAFFHALAPFGDRAFPLGWAAGAAGVGLAEATREASLLRDRCLIVQVGGTADDDHRGEGGEEPRFVLDDHAAWYCAWRAGDARDARAALREHAIVQAGALARLDEAARSERYAADHDLWAIVLAPPRFGQPWRPPADTPPGDPAGTDPELALALWRVLATRPGVLEDAALQSAYARARVEPDGALRVARLALVAGMRLSAVARDQAIAARFLLEAGERLVDERPREAANAWSAAARLVSASDGPAAGLAVMARAHEAARAGGATAYERSLRALDLGQIRVWADMAAPPWDAVDADLDEAARLATDVPGPRGRAIVATARLASHLLRWKRDLARIDDPALIDTVDGLLGSIETSGFTIAALLALRAWALGPRGSTERETGMERARAQFRRALAKARRRNAWTDYNLGEIVWMVWLFRAVPWNEHTERHVLGALDPWVGLAPAPFDPSIEADHPRFGSFLGVAIPVACLAELLSPALLRATARYSIEGRGPDDPDSQRLSELAAAAG